jgi:5-oxoprolinase (ATP-hydrolysing) subunit A
MTRIDLNCDVGEFAEAIADGTQESLLRSLTSVNIACGGHAGDAQTMRATIEQALRHEIAIGAHPGYPDRKNFGRIELQLAPQAIADSVFEQVIWLADIAEAHAARITHVKPHGALYNQAAKDRVIAQAIAEGVRRWDREVVLVGLAGSPMLEVFRDAGFIVAAEAFADRRYEPDGSLRPRKFADSLLHDPAEAAAQALRIAQKEAVVASNGAEILIRAQTICIHGDTPGAPQIAAAVAQALHAAGIQLKSFASE